MLFSKSGQNVHVCDFVMRAAPLRGKLLSSMQPHLPCQGMAGTLQKSKECRQYLITSRWLIWHACPWHRLPICMPGLLFQGSGRPLRSCGRGLGCISGVRLGGNMCKDIAASRNMRLVLSICEAKSVAFQSLLSIFCTSPRQALRRCTGSKAGWKPL